MTTPEFRHQAGAYTWTVDAGAAAKVMPWATRQPRVWAAELTAMRQHFPHWALLAGNGPQPVACKRCGAPIAPTAAGLGCVACGAAAASKPAGLVWVGHLPSLARPEPGFAAWRKALALAGFAEATVGGLAYLLVPLAVVYPPQWPNVEPAVHYAPSWLATLGLPHTSGRHHLIGGGRACLFYWGHWRPMSVASVLQQRVVNHVASLLKIAAGMPPETAFIGRIHDGTWRPQPGGGNA